MRLPDHTGVSPEQIAQLAARHGLPPGPVVRLPDSGIFNAVYLLGDQHVLRVPRQHPAYFRALLRESVAVPLARRAGVHTPALVVYDGSCAVLPVPFTVYERLPGVSLDRLEREPEETPDVWRALGAELTRLHHAVTRSTSNARLEDVSRIADPRELVDELRRGGWITGSESAWLRHWLDRIAPAALTVVEECLIHGDSQSTNVMVDPASDRYLGVIDWGSAGWGDPAWDFAGVPLRAVPFMLEGYRAVAPPVADETIEGRILWRHLQLALLSAKRGPQPQHSWAERPLTMLLEIARFFLGDQPSGWRALRPECG